MSFVRVLLAFVSLLLGFASKAEQLPSEKANQMPTEITMNGVELVLIPAGWFWYSAEVDIGQLPLGSADNRSVKIWLDSFYLAKYEARASDLARFLNSKTAGSSELVSQLKQKEMAEQIKGRGWLHCSLSLDSQGLWQLRVPERNLPATDLSWLLAQEFATWMGFRLPTETEWQKGARGSSDQRSWPWGDNYPDDTFGVFGWTRDCDPASVDSYPKGRSPYGLFHMAGNVGEFVQDWFNQPLDDSLTDGMRNPALALEGTPDPYDGPLKISKSGLWSRDSIGARIKERRKLPLERASIREGVRFAADIDTVRHYLTATKTAQQSQEVR